MDRDEDIYGEYLRSTTDGLLVMASIVATVSFQIAISPPGGFWQDDSSPIATSNATASGHIPGNAILYDRNRKEYTAFVLLNTQVYLASICLIVTLLRPSRNAAKWTLVQGLIYTLAIMIIMLFFMAVEFTTKQIYAKHLRYILVVPWILALLFFYKKAHQAERDIAYAQGKTVFM